MRFNVSRFLVRVRQFWTRERLVPVLGFTALALFLLNFWTFIDHKFNQAPMNASYVFSGNLFSDGDFPHANGSSIYIDSNRHVHKHRHRHSEHRFFRHDHKSKRSHCKNEKQRQEILERYFEVKRFNEEADRFQDKTDQYREEIARLQREAQNHQIRELVNEMKHLSQTQEKKIMIKKHDGSTEFDVTIMVDGEEVELP